MDLNQRLALSYYKTIATINESHKVYLVQHQESNRILIKKILDIYNRNVYDQLYHHPILGTPKIIDCFEDSNQLIIIEEYISGSSLQDKIASHDYTPNDLFSYMIEICNILSDLHSLPVPIIHRDIKPSNIIITTYNHVVLLDFNAAKQFKQTESNDTVLLGTKGYAAPEQYGFGSSSPQTDIYSVGIVFREMLTAIGSADQRLYQIADRCTKLSPAERYSSVSELKQALLELTKKEIPPAKSEKAASILPPGFRSKTPWKMILATLVYPAIMWLGLTLQVVDKTGVIVLIYRVFTLAMMLSVIIGTFNYLNIQNIIPLCKHPKRSIRYLGIFILDLGMVFILFVILAVIDSIFAAF